MGVKYFIVSFDLINYYVNVMHNYSGDGHAKIENLPFDKSLYQEDNYTEIINSTLVHYFSKNNLTVNNLKLVLPDSLVGIDIITVPAVSKSKDEEAVKFTIKDSYINSENLKYEIFLSSSNKIKSCYKVVFTNKLFVERFYKALLEYKMFAKNVTYASFSTLTALLSLNAKYKKKSFIFMDIKQARTNCLVVKNGELFGFSSLPFGYEILESKKVLQEGALFNQDNAYLAVINAKEKALKKKISMLSEEEITTSLTEDEMENYEIENSANDGELDKTTIKINKIKLKELPPSMRRKYEENEQSYQFENFRHFLKKALLINLFNSTNDLLPVAEMVLFNMPEKYAPLLAVASGENENLLPLVYLEKGKGLMTQYGENLEIYGGMLPASFKVKI